VFLPIGSGVIPEHWPSRATTYCDGHPGDLLLMRAVRVELATTYESGRLSKRPKR